MTHTLPVDEYKIKSTLEKFKQQNAWLKECGYFVDDVYDSMSDNVKSAFQYLVDAYGCDFVVDLLYENTKNWTTFIYAILCLERLSTKFEDTEKLRKEWKYTYRFFANNLKDLYYCLSLTNNQCLPKGSMVYTSILSWAYPKTWRKFKSNKKIRDIFDGFYPTSDNDTRLFVLYALFEISQVREFDCMLYLPFIKNIVSLEKDALDFLYLLYLGEDLLTYLTLGVGKLPLVELVKTLVSNKGIKRENYSKEVYFTQVASLYIKGLA